MIVLVAGGYGCGTTHVYGIVRRIFYRAGLGHVGRGISHDVLEAERLLELPGRYVYKTHNAIVEPGPDLLVILCRRALLDAAASHARRNSLEAVLNGIRQLRALERAYDRIDVPHIDYEYYYGRPRAKVAVLAELLGVSLGPAAIAAIAYESGIASTRRRADALAPGTADSDTELRPGHIGERDGLPGAGADLPPAFRKQIEAEYDRA